MFKKIVSNFFFPVLLGLELLLLGLILLWFTPRKTLGKIVILLGVILLAGLSFIPFADMLLTPLEYRYPPLTSLERHFDVKWIVVLGAGHKNDPRIPFTAKLDRPCTVRLTEAIRLHNLLPDTKLILSEGGAVGQVPGARIMADLALALGVDREDIVLEPLSRDTEDQARLIKKLIKNDRLILVTSASHMPRSMALFKKTGLRPIPAPTDHLVKKDPRGRDFGEYFPNAEGILKARTAFHEYMGLIWAKARGQI
ncbi:MAG: YdcF family protein [Deltaproteobacteria bacterium]|nr:YdcF family protein [Deltaproteobacteria bacterium]